MGAVYRSSSGDLGTPRFDKYLGDAHSSRGQSANLRSFKVESSGLPKKMQYPAFGGQVHFAI